MPLSTTSTYSAFNLNLDYILPFTAISENGHEIDGIDDKSELTHRVTLVNFPPLLDAIRTKKASSNFLNTLVLQVQSLGTYCPVIRLTLRY